MVLSSRSFVAEPCRQRQRKFQLVELSLLVILWLCLSIADSFCFFDTIQWSGRKSFQRISSQPRLRNRIYFIPRNVRWIPFQSSSGDEASTSASLSSVSLPTIHSPRLADIGRMRHKVMACLAKNDVRAALRGIKAMIKVLSEISRQGNSLSDCSAEIDRTLQAFYNHAFATPYGGRDATKRIALGLEALQLQLSSKTLEPPYNTIPKTHMLGALKALTRANELQNGSIRDSARQLVRTDAAYRVLQRLVTGVGIRHFDSRTKRIHECDFNTVLNAYSNIGKMNMAHRVVALQERTAHAPPISPVGYSILLKGYGRLSDTQNIEMLLEHAEASQVVADTVMLNSLIDAYVNCNKVDKAIAIFRLMKDPSAVNETSAARWLFLFSGESTPRPNRRTYNTVLKGMGNAGLLEDAVELSLEMEKNLMWDAVTTNTLVHAAIRQKEFVLAEQFLSDYTEETWETKSGRHPNVEAYTNLLDGYAKAGNLVKAIATLRVMERRNVDPNVITFTCLLGALARHKKLEQVQKTMSYMEARGIKPTLVTYNAIISGLVTKGHPADGYSNLSFDDCVDEALQIVRKMMGDGIRPDAVIISVLVGAFGECERPRVAEGKSLIDKLELDGIVSANSTRIATALVKLCGVGEDFAGALDAFKRVIEPDVAAVNALLDACSRCGRERVLTQTFKEYFLNRIEPDVISYSVMIGSLLNENKVESVRQARMFYEEMKDRRRIVPDNALVDIILKALISKGRNGGLQSFEEQFLASILSDANNLDWGRGHLERRIRAVQSVMTRKLIDVRASDSDRHSWLVAEEADDEMFKRHGWNRVDSGFRLWGGGVLKRRDEKDEFLDSKGWNNVDSGFRII